MTGPLDEIIARIAGRLTALPQFSFALFFAYAAERLTPLYVAFERKHNWGDSVEIRKQLDGVWNFLILGHAITSDVSRLAVLTPDGEKFDAPDSTYAQDVVICVDAAVRTLMGETPNGEWIEFAIEPIKTKISIELTGYASDESSNAQSRLLADQRVAVFVAECEDVISALERGRPGIASELQERARSSRLNVAEYFRS